MWTDAADAQGRAAYLEAERQIELRRTPAELARRPLPEEAAQLAELQASVDVAVGLVEAAMAEVAATFPPIVEGSARQISGPVGFNLLGERRPGPAVAANPVATATRFLAARQKMYDAQAVEGKARSRHTSYQMLIQEAGHRRYLAMTADGEK